MAVSFVMLKVVHLQAYFFLTFNFRVSSLLIFLVGAPLGLSHFCLDKAIYSGPKLHQDVPVLVNLASDVPGVNFASSPAYTFVQLGPGVQLGPLVVHLE